MCYLLSKPEALYINFTLIFAKELFLVPNELYGLKCSNPQCRVYLTDAPLWALTVISLCIPQLPHLPRVDMSMGACLTFCDKAFSL